MSTDRPTQNNSPAATPSKSVSAARKIPKLRFPWIIAAGFLLASSALAVVVVMAYRATRLQVSSSHAVLHSRDVLDVLTDYGNAVKNASNIAMDYYNNGTESDVQAFPPAANATRAAIGKIRDITADDPSQQKFVSDLARANEQAIDLLNNVMELHRKGFKGTKPLQDLTKAGRGMSLNLNKTYLAMSAEENNLMKARTRETEAASLKALRLELWGGIAAGLLMLVAIVLFLRESFARIDAQRELANANADLEQRILDRIAEVEYVNQLLTSENAERIAAEEQVRQMNVDLERRVIERTVQLEAANQDLESFCYSVSHDLRAPLRHIDGFSKILAEDFGPQLSTEAQHCLKRIQAAINNMGNLVDDLLNLSRVSRKGLALQTVKLSDTVRDARAEIAPEQKGRRIDWQVGDLPTVQGDPNLLKQVFINLLANAVKFTRGREAAVIQVGQEIIDGETVIFVRDNGVGFNMKYADKLFGVFQRLHTPEEFEGTGVGLATVQRIIQKHGGRVWAESEPDRGAAFFFTIGDASAYLPNSYSAGERIVS